MKETYEALKMEIVVFDADAIDTAVASTDIDPAGSLGN